MKRFSYLLLCLSLSIFSLEAAPSWYAEMQGDTLVMGNSLIERRFLWNGGNLRTISVEDRATGKIHWNLSKSPDLVLVGGADKGEDGAMTQAIVCQNEIHPAYLKVSVNYSTGALDILREYRIYEDVPAIACDTYLKGEMALVPSRIVENAADNKNIEFSEDIKVKPVTAVLDRIHLKGRHWRAKAVEFWDVTDWNNTLIRESEFISYHKTSYRGNILFVRNGEDLNGLFFLKEAPCSSVQLAYNGADFISDNGHFMVTGVGVKPSDLNDSTYTKAYSVVMGVYSEGELAALTSLRRYQKTQRRHIPKRDNMIMMNTWGDRSQDTKVNESFCLEELEKAARLGITHFQIDDGWQYGKSPNSAIARGSFKNIWDNPDYWAPDPQKYPHGLKPIVEKGKESGIEIGLWYNPSVQNDFEDWKKDADAIVGLYEKYGIRIFKIDGLTISSKKGEENLRRLFDSVLARTDNQVMFNLDATASRRGGYHFLCEYGNIFLENRYTDWSNYYPYWTLRNLWMLSRYVPAERLQIEFLNNYRNVQRYGDDVFAPASYSFEYLFATSMAGQPLAWMEASNLPEDAYQIAPVINKYRELSADFHSGTILPIGEEPSGRSWTGFQSLTGENTGYVIVYRELNDDVSASVRTWLGEGVKVSFELVLGQGKSFKTKVGKDGMVSFILPDRNTYALYRYSY